MTVTSATVLPVALDSARSPALGLVAAHLAVVGQIHPQPASGAHGVAGLLGEGHHRGTVQTRLLEHTFERTQKK